MTTIKLFLFIIIGVLSLRKVDTFLIQKHRGRLGTKTIQQQSPSFLLSTPKTTAVTTTNNKITKKPDKLTKEAQELLDVLKTKKQDYHLNDDEMIVMAQVAPSVRVAISEEFDLGPGELPVGNLVAALKQLGFDIVLDTNTAADITIVEEGTELLKRLQEREKNPNPDASMPLFTSCCPGWLNLVEKNAPELAPYISTCKSPHMMYGALMKHYSTELLDKPPEKIYFTSVMPCVRKRGESDHEAFEHDGIRDVDNVITTKDTGQLLRMKGIDPTTLDPMPFDSPFLKVDGQGSGAGQLFGATGGVMEAAVRTVYQVATGEMMPRLEMEEVRGLEGVKEAVIQLHDPSDQTTGLPSEIRVAVANGLGNAKKLIKKIKDGEVHFDFVEVMACPGGCIGGGGQPRGDKESINKRMEHIYELDRNLPRRCSHDNPTVQRFYDGKEGEFLGEYGSEKAHDLLHVEPVYGKKPTLKKKKEE